MYSANDLLTAMSDSDRSARAWIGVDVSKKTFDAALWAPLEEGRSRELKDIPARTFSRDEEGVQALHTWVRRRLDPYTIADGERARARVVMEATGSYSAELTGWMIERDPSLSPAIVNPETTSAFIKSLALRNRGDRADARALSRYGHERRPSPYQPPSAELSELRDLSRHRQVLIAMRVADSHRAQEPHGSPFVRKLLASRVARMRKDEEKIEAEMERVVAKADRFARDVDLLKGVYGVGFITAATVLAEFGDLRRFETGRQLSASAGLSPRNVDSGTSVHKRPRLSKKGNNHVRKALYFPALAAIRGDSDLSDLYNRLVSSGKPRKAAVGAVMRKMLLVMRAILISGEPYQKRYRQPVDSSRRACAEPVGG